MTLLAACPFCGKTDTLKVVPALVDAAAGAYVRCHARRGCGALGPEADTEEEAARLWNTRTGGVAPMKASDLRLNEKTGEEGD